MKKFVLLSIVVNLVLFVALIANAAEKHTVTQTMNLTALERSCVDDIISQTMLPVLNASGQTAAAADVEVFRVIFKNDEEGNPVAEAHIIARPEVTIVYSGQQ